MAERARVTSPNPPAPVVTTGAAAAAFDTLRARIGQEVHVSDWMPVTQQRIDAFAAATDDRQWIHTDPQRAQRESPYGAPIAHGYLTLSLQIPLRGLVREDQPYVAGVRSVVNYGLNKLRFPNAVRVGSRIRGRFTLVSVEAISASVLQVAEQYTVEIDGQAKPACSAESVMRLQF
jgi:acyl dehydratase